MGYKVQNVQSSRWLSVAIYSLSHACSGRVAILFDLDVLRIDEGRQLSSRKRPPWTRIAKIVHDHISQIETPGNFYPASDTERNASLYIYISVLVGCWNERNAFLYIFLITFKNRISLSFRFPAAIGTQHWQPRVRPGKPPATSTPPRGGSSLRDVVLRHKATPRSEL